MECSEVKCSRCAGVDDSHLVEPVVCVACRARGQLPGFEEQLRDAALLSSLRVRLATQAAHRTGLRDYRAWASRWLDQPLPASADELLAYIAYSVRKRQPTLDSTTVTNYVHAVGAWHAQAAAAWHGHLVNPAATKQVKLALKIIAKEYKKPSQAKSPLSLQEWQGMWSRGFRDTPQGAHQRLALLLLTLGPFRPSAATTLRVKYEVRGGAVQYAQDSPVRVVRNDPAWREPYIAVQVGTGVYGDADRHRDKNVSAANRRCVPIPARALGVRPVAELERYLREVHPPSGGFLLAAPLGRAARFSKARYGNAGGALNTAYERAHGVRHPKLGAGSPRKSLSQWLLEAKVDPIRIMDIGGWAIDSTILRRGNYARATVPDILQEKRDLVLTLQGIYASRP